MSGRQPQAPVVNPGMRSSAELARRAAAAKAKAQAKASIHAWGPPAAAAASERPQDNEQPLQKRDTSIADTSLDKAVPTSEPKAKAAPAAAPAAGLPAGAPGPARAKDTSIADTSLDKAVPTSEPKAKAAPAAAPAAGLPAGAPGPARAKAKQNVLSTGHGSNAINKPRAISEGWATKVLDVLKRGNERGRSFLVGKLAATGYCSHIVSYIHRELEEKRIEGITWGQNEVVSGNRTHTMWFNAVTSLPVETAKAAILKACRARAIDEFERFVRHRHHNRPDAEEEERWRTEPLQLEWAVSPSARYEGSEVAVPEQMGRKRWFTVFKVDRLELDLERDVAGAAYSNTAELLETMLQKSFGDVGAAEVNGLTAAHFAILSGHVGVAQAVMAEASKLERPHWQDRNGRTPLHMAALFPDPNLAAAAMQICDRDTKDRWGLTAEDIARHLDHELVRTFLAGVPAGLHQLSALRFRELLGTQPDSPAVATMLRDMSDTAASHLADNIPLHDYPALSTLAAVFPGLVPPERLAQSMSCMECCYGDRFLKGMGAGIPENIGLVSVWDDLDSFKPGSHAASSALSGTVLAMAGNKDKKPLTVADRETFLQRFHKRTGGLFRKLDWTNLRVIGGMCLACLIADDEDFARFFKDTDVDFYVVGLSGQAYKDRVASLIESLPSPAQANDRNEVIEPAANGGKLFFHWRKDFRNQSLVITEVKENKPNPDSYRSAPNLQFGDHIIELTRVGAGHGCGGETITGPSQMEKALLEMARNPKTEVCRWSKRTLVEEAVLLIRPSEAMPMNRKYEGCAVRTPQTITVCSSQQDGSFKPLPNTQVVLAPYANTAHLLFTTDIDCTAMAFDGSSLLAAPRAREAIRHRRNIVRPEKYMVRGEFRTEARLLKYARRGFEVFDLGINGFIPKSKELDNVNTKAAEWFNQGLKADELKEKVEVEIRSIQSTDVHGAQLLFQAARSYGLRMTMTFEKPMLKPGLKFADAVEVVHGARTRSSRTPPFDHPNDDDDDEAAELPPHVQDLDTRTRGRLGLHRRGRGGDGEASGARRNEVQYCDGYGKATSQCVIVNPMRRTGGGRVRCGSLRGYEMSLSEAIVEMDLESDRFEVRSWYDGIPERALNAEYAALDPSVWKGIGDFRKAA